tara:strand:+ start:1559 stop:1720 length:162 start_codon:yes stop_codon:yes gene_type:complete
MKVKTVTAWTVKGLDKKINKFIEGADVRVLNIKPMTNLFIYEVLVMYEVYEMR